MTYIIKERIIPTQISSRSCVGYYRSAPAPYKMGNYFSFADGSRCVNFWLENLQEAENLFLLDHLIKVNIFSEPDRQLSWAIIIDDRIPKDWCNSNFCFTGHHHPSEDTLIAMYDSVNDHSCNRELFIDPINYYRNHGVLKSNGMHRDWMVDFQRCSKCK